MTATLFDEWTENRAIRSIGTNTGAPALAFQSWHRFKEAFPPEFVRHALDSSGEEIRACLDPFGGSGTTALASQFLGVSSTTIEVNPFLVDVINAKLDSYDVDELTSDFAHVCQLGRRLEIEPSEYFSHTPATFIEPGVSGRWIFNRAIATRLGALLAATDQLKNEAHRRLFRILVAGLLVDVSNVSMSGKGRRYRRAWQTRELKPAAVDSEFRKRSQSAIADIHRFSRRPAVRCRVINGDARSAALRRTHDVAVFSPPYPNSFDYTDVYNVELWMLGYLQSSDGNRALRGSTLTSHVQLYRDYPAAPVGSRTLQVTLKRLETIRDALWSRWIPNMIGGYFTDLAVVLERVRRALRDSGLCWLVVGDSRYGGVAVPAARILGELASEAGWTVESTRPFRTMRSSPQHGGREELPETLLCLRKSGS